jgi:hypothetical protein
MRRWHVFSIALAGVALMTACGPSSSTRDWSPRPSPRVEKALGGKSVLTIIKQPKDVQAYRLQPQSAQEVRSERKTAQFVFRGFC